MNIKKLLFVLIVSIQIVLIAPCFEGGVASYDLVSHDPASYNQKDIRTFYTKFLDHVGNDIDLLNLHQINLPSKYWIFTIHSIGIGGRLQEFLVHLVQNEEKYVLLMISFILMMM